MSTLKNFKQFRNLPNPIGQPDLHFVPYSFGQMKPLPAANFTVTLTPAWQTYLDIFLPANSWALLKQLIVKCGVVVVTNAPGGLGGVTYSEAYSIGNTGIVPRFGAITAPTSPAITKLYYERKFSFDGTNVVEENYNGTTPNQGVSSADGIIHTLIASGAGPAFDPTIDNHMLFLIKSNTGAPLDTVSKVTASAFIQSPLDLRRLPR